MEPQTTSASIIPGIQYLRTGHHGGNFPLALYNPVGQQIHEDFAVTEVPASVTNTILLTPLTSLRAAANRDERIDLTHFATPERYRFIDCVRFVHDGILQVWETQERPEHQFAAISHVWKSLPPEEDPKMTTRGVFLVECEDRNDGGPISIDVLRYTCLASLQAGVRLLWLDRLCIIQTATPEGKKDKRWQIMHMHDIYKGCSICFVLPAGLRRFPMKSEETEWVERAWTFQEVMVAPLVKVLYTEYIGSPPEIFVHRMEIDEYFRMQQRLHGDDRDGSQQHRQQFLRALDNRQEYKEPTSEHLSRFRDVWEFMQWRRSANPVDVVFSVIGLLGVTLDPAQFGKGDRLRAAIAVAQACLLKDDSLNTCIDIPLWKKLPRSKASLKYMANLPIHVRLQDLDKELDSQPLRRFAGFTRMSLLPGFEADKVEDEDFERLKDVKAVVMGGSGQADEEIQSFLAGLVDISAKSRRRAERMRSLIPLDLLCRAYDTKTQDHGPRIFFRNQDEGPVVELCHTLSFEDSVIHGSSRHVFGWSIQSTLWVKLGRYSHQDDRSKRSVPVPIITLFKFSIDS